MAPEKEAKQEVKEEETKKEEVVEETTKEEESKPDNPLDFDEPADEEAQSEKSEDKDAADEDSGGTEEAEAEDQKEAEQKPVFDENLLAKAETYGISREEAEKEFGTPEVLTKVVGKMEAQARAAAVDAEDESGKKAEGQAEAELKEIELDPDMFDPQIIAAIRALEKRGNDLAAKLAEKEKVATDTKVADVDAKKSEFSRAFDSELKELPEEFSELLGTEAVRSFQGKEKDPKYLNRLKLIDEMNSLSAGYMQTGKEIPAVPELMRRALNIAFPDQAKKGARKELAKDLEKRKGAMTGRAADRKTSSSLTPEESARKKVAEKLRGYGAEEEDKESFE